MRVDWASVAVVAPPRVLHPPSPATLVASHFVLRPSQTVLWTSRRRYNTPQ
jgi:hypothetical protein